MQASNDFLGTEKVGKLMLKFSVPCILSLLVGALYNIVDQIFIGQGVGFLGNGATNVVFPITIIALSLALLIGDGSAAFLSICQGRQDKEGGHKTVGNAIVLNIIVGVAYMVLLILFRDPALKAFGATANNMSYAQEYFNYLVLGIPFFMFSTSMNGVIRADGNPKFAMLATLAGAIINIILDPIAIFVLGWGMKGAALATIAGQIVSALLAVSYLMHAKHFKLSKKSFSLEWKLIKKIIPLGMSSFLTQISIVAMTAAMNNVLVIYGAQSIYGADIPLTVVGIVMKVFQIVIAIVVGIAVGAQPIVGYNIGANKLDRVKEAFKKMLIAEVIVGSIALVLFEVFPLQIISVFGSESALYNDFAVMTFRIYFCTIILCCVQKSTSIFLQSLGRSAERRVGQECTSCCRSRWSPYL